MLHQPACALILSASEGSDDSQAVALTASREVRSLGYQGHMLPPRAALSAVKQNCCGDKGGTEREASGVK